MESWLFSKKIKNQLHAMHHCAESIFIVNYFREYESIFETALAYESVDPGVLFDEKTRGRKYCEPDLFKLRSK
jgi:hypothetical protein